MYKEMFLSLLFISIPIASNASSECGCYIKGKNGVSSGSCPVQFAGGPDTAYSVGSFDRRNGSNQKSIYCSGSNNTSVRSTSSGTKQTYWVWCERTDARDIKIYGKVTKWPVTATSPDGAIDHAENDFSDRENCFKAELK